MIGKVILLGMAIAFTMACVSTGCRKSSSNDSPASASSNAPAAQPSGLEREAQDAGFAEIQKHWLKGPDGWTSLVTTGSPYAPDHYLRQYRELTVESIEPFPLVDSDRLNGFEWAGRIVFKQVPCREAGDPGIMLDGTANVVVNRQNGRWTQWVEYTPGPLRVQKQKGKWTAEADNTFVSGKIPGPADFAKAGVAAGSRL